MVNSRLIPDRAEYFTLDKRDGGRELKIRFYRKQDVPPGRAVTEFHPVAELPGMIGRPDIDAVIDQMRVTPFPGRQKPRNKYDREILPDVWVDVYDVLGAFTGKVSALIKPAVDHALKKLLAPGPRGVKEERQDLIEARDSIDRAIQKLDEWA